MPRCQISRKLSTIAPSESGRSLCVGSVGSLTPGWYFAIIARSLPRLRLLPLRIVLQREQLLNPLGAAAAWVEQHLQRFADAGQARVLAHAVGAAAAADSVQDRGQVQELAARLQKMALQR